MAGFLVLHEDTTTHDAVTNHTATTLITAQCYNIIYIGRCVCVCVGVCVCVCVCVHSNSLIRVISNILWVGGGYSLLEYNLLQLLGSEY